MDYSDGFLFSTRERRLDFLNMVRRVPPDIILMRSPPDYHPDDRTTSQTLWDICAMTTIPNIETEAVPCEVIPEIYHFDTLAGIDFTPEFSHYERVGHSRGRNLGAIRLKYKISVPTGMESPSARQGSSFWPLLGEMQQSFAHTVNRATSVRGEIFAGQRQSVLDAISIFIEIDLDIF